MRPPCDSACLQSPARNWCETSRQVPERKELAAQPGQHIRMARRSVHSAAPVTWLAWRGDGRPFVRPQQSWTSMRGLPRGSADQCCDETTVPQAWQVSICRLGHTRLVCRGAGSLPVIERMPRRRSATFLLPQSQVLFIVCAASHRPRVRGPIYRPRAWVMADASD
jgi:hypothetical protein